VRRSDCYVCGEEVLEGRPLVDASTAARLCRVARSTIYRWIRDEQVEWVRLPQGRRRIYLDSLFEERPAIFPERGPSR